jgi:hypothetical protein
VDPRDKPELVTGPGCALDSNNLARCDLMVKGSLMPPVHTAAKFDPVPPSVDVCNDLPSMAPTPFDKAPPPPVAPTSFDNAPPRLSRIDLLKALDDYTAALSAITNAQDRADFDNATAKVSAAVGNLARSVVPGYGAAAVPSFKTSTSTNVFRWLVGQDLEYRRLQELQGVTRASCAPIHTLVDALGLVLEEQRNARLTGLFDLLVRKTQAVNRARAAPHVSDQDYRAAIEEAEAVADEFQKVRDTDPHATAQGFRDAHDALVIAVRNNNGQFAALAENVHTFVRRVGDLATAAQRLT